VPLPSGVVTFLFSDIEGSTRLWESEPEAMRVALGQHDELVSGAIERAGGRIFKHTGDGFGAAFESVSSALEAAAGIASAIGTAAWDGVPIRCRIGVHSGEAEPQDGDYFGPVVTRTARVTDAANGGQITVTAAAHRLVSGAAPSGTSFVDVGEHRLKDLGEPIGLFRLNGPGAEDDRPLRTLETAPHNLPVQLSRFVGREAQIKEVADLVKTTRLVTLTGIGGVGKTRLSLQVAAEVLAEFDHGAWFVELAPLAEQGLVADTVADALDIPQDTTVSSEQRVLQYLADRAALIVVDNCEHLIDEVADFVDRLLRACPDMHVLTTSREGLAVTGEALWRVPSLRVDDDAAAVELFAERARLVRPDFVVNDGNRQTVADLCVRLDGIPLAIELATARLKMLSVEQIAEHLGDRFRLLTGGSRTAVERQRTLLAMMDWSYDLLSAEEQALLRRLAVFYDGFTYEAAEEVCSGDTLPRFEVLDLLGRLVEASMVTFDSDPTPRYRLLETVRQYSLDKLVDAGEADEARLRHTEYFHGLALELEKRLDRDDDSAMDDGHTELGNYRAAMTWASEAGHGEMLLDLATALRMYFWNRVMYRESIRWITTAVDMIPDDTVTDRYCTAIAFVLTDAGNSSDVESVERFLPIAEHLFETADSDLGRGVLANALATSVLDTDYRTADKRMREAHQMLRAAGSPRWASSVQNRFISSWFLNSREHEEEIRALTAEAVAEGISIHDRVIDTCFTLLAEDYERVIEIAETATPRNDWEEAMLLLFRVVAERALGRLDDALQTAARVDTITGPNAPGTTNWHRAVIHLQRGDEAAAIASFRNRQTIFGDTWSRATSAALWAMISERRGNHENAATLWGFFDSISERSGLGRPRFEAEIQEASRQRSAAAIGAERFDQLVMAGRDISWEDLPLVHEARTS
jgi:predicted ATPase/class 3 adenylate cyclase